MQVNVTQGSTTSSDETVVRYSSQYDQKLDPFTSFSKQERLRKYMDLRPYDKITLGMVSTGGCLFSTSHTNLVGWVAQW